VATRRELRSWTQTVEARLTTIGADGERVGADGGEGEDLGIGADDGSAGGEGIGGGTGGGRGDETVAAIAGEGFAVDGDLDLNEAGRGAAAEDEVVEGDLDGRFRAALDGGFEEGAFVEGELPGEDAAEGFGEFLGRDRGEEAKVADIDAEDGNGQAGDLAGDAEHGAVAAEDEEQVDVADDGVEGIGSGEGIAAETGRVRVGDDRALEGTKGSGRLSNEGGGADLLWVGDEADAADGFGVGFQALAVR
jgi:hypothetical protein